MVNDLKKSLLMDDWVKKMWYTPCLGVAQMVRVLTQYARVVGSIPSQGTYKNPPMSASVHGTTDPSFSLSPSSSEKLIDTDDSVPGPRGKGTREGSKGHRGPGTW